jgi:hypothetical protein
MLPIESGITVSQNYAKHEISLLSGGKTLFCLAYYKENKI